MTNESAPCVVALWSTNQQLHSAKQLIRGRIHRPRSARRSLLQEFVLHAGKMDMLRMKTSWSLGWGRWLETFIIHTWHGWCDFFNVCRPRAYWRWSCHQSAWRFSLCHSLQQVCQQWIASLGPAAPSGTKERSAEWPNLSWPTPRYVQHQQFDRRLWKKNFCMVCWLFIVDCSFIYGGLIYWYVALRRAKHLEVLHSNCHSHHSVSRKQTWPDSARRLPRPTRKIWREAKAPRAARKTKRTKCSVKWKKLTVSKFKGNLEVVSSNRNITSSLLDHLLALTPDVIMLSRRGLSIVCVLPFAFICTRLPWENCPCANV